ncbi:MAG: hypothetical protein ACRCVT_05295 [Leadbetterella sp.]
MRFILLCILPVISFAQQSSFRRCDSLLVEQWPNHYFTFKAKYPLSSETLAENINAILNYKPQNINGFITVRFLVNCARQTGEHEIYQIDTHYQQTVFDPKYVDQILHFVKSLQDWKLGIHKEKTYDYYAYLTFKIEQGFVKEVVP